MLKNSKVLILMAEEYMVNQLEMLTVWIPDRMKPGMIFPLDKPIDHPQRPHDPFWAVLACPECGTTGLVSRLQVAGLCAVICGTDLCSAEFFLRGDGIVPRKPM